VFTHRHDRHQTSVSKAVARVIEVRWFMKKRLITGADGESSKGIGRIADLIIIK
jgi:hypothetical protein